MHESWYLGIGLIYLAFTFATHEVMRLYVFKNLLKMGETSTSSSIVSEVREAHHSLKIHNQFYVVSAYLWPVTLVVYIFSTLFDFLWKIITMFRYTEKGK